MLKLKICLELINETEQIINKNVLLTTIINLLNSRSQKELLLIHELVSNLVSLLDKNQIKEE